LSQTEILVQKLNTLIKVTMLSAFKQESKEEKIILLADLGIQNQEIAEILGTTSNYVAKVKSEAKKEAKQPKPVRKEKQKPSEENIKRTK